MESQIFIDVELDKLGSCIEIYKSRGWRLANLCCSSTENRIEVLYSFADGKIIENLRILTDDSQKIPSVSALFPNAFFFENEAHDLYGLSFEGSILNYDGCFYTTSVPTPMNPASSAAQQYLSFADPQE